MDKYTFYKVKQILTFSINLNWENKNKYIFVDVSALFIAIFKILFKLSLLRYLKFKIHKDQVIN